MVGCKDKHSLAVSDSTEISGLCMPFLPSDFQGDVGGLVDRVNDALVDRVIFHVDVLNRQGEIASQR